MQVYPRGTEKLGPLSRWKLVASGKSGGGGALKSAQTDESSSSGKTAPRRETREVYNMQIGTTNPSHHKRLRG